MGIQTINNVGYGLTSALPTIFNAPISSTRNPKTTDKAPIGQIWINHVAQTAYILVSVSNNTAVWNLIEAGGTGGAFSTLTSTGATTLATTGASVNTFGNTTGATSLTLSAGTAGIIFNSTTPSEQAFQFNATDPDGGAIFNTGFGGFGVVTSNNGPFAVFSGTGTIGMGTDATAATMLLNTGAGAKTTTLGSTNTTATTTIQAGTGGLALNAAGAVSMAPATVSAAAYAATLNARVGAVTLTGQVLASAAAQDLTITNSLVSSTSQIFVTVGNIGSNDAKLTIQRVNPGTGSFIVNVKNNGAAALNGDIHVTFWVIN